MATERVAFCVPSPTAADIPFLPFRFVRLPEVCELTSLSRSQIYRLQKAGLFPKNVKLSQAASAWLDTEIAQWQAERVAASRPAAFVDTNVPVGTQKTAPRKVPVHLTGGKS